MMPVMKLVYRLEFEVPDDIYAIEVGAVLQWTAEWFRLKGWKAQITSQTIRGSALRHVRRLDRRLQSAQQSEG